MDQKKEEPKNDSMSWNEILAYLDYFQTVVSRIQEDQEDNRMRLDYHQQTISELIDGGGATNEFMKYKFNVDLLEFGFESYAGLMEDQGYEEKLRQQIRTQKEVTKEARANRKISYIELAQQLNESDERIRVLNGIQAMAIVTGTKLSRFLVEYFLLISGSKRKGELVRKIQAVKSAIESESLEGNSAIIDTFVSVVEYVGQEMVKRGSKKDARREEASTTGKDDLLGMILFEVLNFEIAFSRPIFLPTAANNVFLQVIGDYISALLDSKLKAIASYMNAHEAGASASSPDHQGLIRRNKLKNKLDAGIEKFWNQLELQPMN